MSICYNIKDYKVSYYLPPRCAVIGAWVSFKRRRRKRMQVKGWHFKHTVRFVSPSLSQIWPQKSYLLTHWITSYVLSWSGSGISSPYACTTLLVAKCKVVKCIPEFRVSGFGYQLHRTSGVTAEMIAEIPELFQCFPSFLPSTMCLCTCKNYSWCVRVCVCYWP